MYMVRQIAELHRMAGQLYHVTRKGGTLYTRTKDTPTDKAAERMAEAARHLTAATRHLNRAKLLPVFVKEWADILNYQNTPTSENAPLQKLKQEQLPIPNNLIFDTMKQQNTTTAKKYEVTPRTGKFIAAIEAIAAAEDAVYEAMADMYGEDNTLIEKIPFEAVKQAVAEFLYIGIAENVQDSKGGTITI